MNKLNKVGVITSGGDCGGLNAVIKGVAIMGDLLNLETYVIPNGYAGLYNLVEFDSLVELDFYRTDKIEANPAGSEAGHSRVQIKKIKDEKKYERIKEGMKKFGLEGLIISGGDDTGSVVIDLLKQGIPCVHAPKTMDLDLQPYSVGGDSTVNRITRFVQELRTTARTHNRVLVIEVFGRYAGHTAFRGGVGADADAILIPEIPVDFDVVYKHLKMRYMKRILDSDVKAGSYMIVVAEGIKNANGQELVDDSAGLDAFGHKKLAGAGKYTCKEIEKRMKADPEVKEFMKKSKMWVEGIYEIPEVREVSPGHLVRAGNSSTYDVNFGKEIGGAAVLLMSQGITGVTVVNVKGNKIYYMPVAQAIKQRFVDLDQVGMHEMMGICFGREMARPKFEYLEFKGVPERHL
jgi:6-phosphofructokinase 1